MSNSNSDLDTSAQTSDCAKTAMDLNAIGRFVAHIVRLLFPVPLWVYGCIPKTPVLSAGYVDQLTSEQAKDRWLKWIVLQQNSVRLIANPPAAWAAP